MPKGHQPEPTVGDGIEEITPRKAIRAVAVAAEHQTTIWVGLNSAMNRSTDVDTQERNAQVGNGIDQVLDQKTAFIIKLIKLTAERNDMHARVDPANAGDSVAIEALRNSPECDTARRRWPW